jgi:hypothetical protein
MNQCDPRDAAVMASEAQPAANQQYNFYTNFNGTVLILRLNHIYIYIYNGHFYDEKYLFFLKKNVKCFLIFSMSQIFFQITNKLKVNNDNFKFNGDFKSHITVNRTLE